MEDTLTAPPAAKIPSSIAFAIASVLPVVLLYTNAIFIYYLLKTLILLFSFSIL